MVAIKELDGAGQMLNRLTPGGFESTLPVGAHLRQDLQKPHYQIVDAADWIETARYSIKATLPEGAPPSGLPVLLLNLPKDRF